MFFQIKPKGDRSFCWYSSDPPASSYCAAEESYRSPCLPSLSYPLAFCAFSLAACVAHLCLPLAKGRPASSGCWSVAVGHDCFASSPLLSSRTEQPAPPPASARNWRRGRAHWTPSPLRLRSFPARKASARAYPTLSRVPADRVSVSPKFQQNSNAEPLSDLMMCRQGREMAVVPRQRLRIEASMMDG